MPMALLVRLCGARLPLQIDDPLDIQKCDILRTAQLIEADLPPVLYERGRSVYSGQATVVRVTAKGHAAAKRHEDP